MAENNKKQTPCVAFDADVLRMLAGMHACLEQDPNYDFSQYKDEFIKRNHQDLLMLLDLIKTGKLHVFIGNTVFHQVKHRQEVIPFIKEFCYFPKLDVAVLSDLLIRTDDLAMQYCLRYNFNGVEKFAPMNLQYIPSIRKEAPSDDAYIMAEATIASCMFITNNGRHFIRYDHIDKDKNSRAMGILTINNLNGYKQILENGETITPKPVLVLKFCEWLKSYGVDGIRMPDAKYENFELGSNVL